MTPHNFSIFIGHTGRLYRAMGFVLVALMTMVTSMGLLPVLLCLAKTEEILQNLAKKGSAPN